MRLENLEKVGGIEDQIKYLKNEIHKLNLQIVKGESYLRNNQKLCKRTVHDNRDYLEYRKTRKVFLEDQLQKLQ